MIAFMLAAALMAPSPSPSPIPSPPPPPPTMTPSASRSPQAASLTIDAAHDGSDVDHAIIITASNQRTGVAAELSYLVKQPCGAKGRWQITKQTTIETVTNYFDQLDTECSDGSATKSFFFDVTSFFGKS
jgi:hypothetical protein